jgi:hypothetical protein
MEDLFLKMNKPYGNLVMAYTYFFCNMLSFTVIVSLVTCIYFINNIILEFCQTIKLNFLLMFSIGIHIK